jgi:hypothetical protein
MGPLGLTFIGVSLFVFVSTILLLLYLNSKKYKKYADNIEESVRKLETETLGYIWQEHRRKVIEYEKEIQTETLSIVLIEGREHHLMKLCLENLNKQLPTWKIHLVHGLDNETFVNTLLEQLSFDVQLTKLNKPNLQVIEFSSLIGTEHFWKNIANTDRVLLTQTDAWVCDNSKYDIRDFFVYDYVGAPWIRHMKSEPSQKETFIVGNCGFCLCKRKTMLETVQKYSYKQFVIETNSHAVDVYFSRYISNVAPPMIAKSFSVENIWYDRPVGVHKPFKMDIQVLEKLELFCDGVLNLQNY